MQPPYVELQCASYFSFLQGCSSPDELFVRAQALGLEALAIADRNTLAGMVRAHVAARATGVRLIVGCRLDAHRNDVFRQVVSVIFNGHAVRSGSNPVESDKRLIGLFESAGAEAVAACMRGDRKLGYYLEALRVSTRDL